MSERVQGVLAYLIAIGMVAAVAAVPTVAQEADENAERIFEVAGFNADSVDGRHAVKYTTKKTQRAGKLVATNKGGYLPPNIVKPKWGLISGKPAGFADGVDNAGVTQIKVNYVSNSVSTSGMIAGSTKRIDATCAAGKVVGGGGGQNFYGFHLLDSKPNISNGWQVWYEKEDAAATSSTLHAYAICLTTTPGSALAAKGKFKTSGKSRR